MQDFFLFCFFSRKKRMLFFFVFFFFSCWFVVLNLYSDFFCNVCFLRKIKCILILKKTKLTLSSLFWWLEQSSLLHPPVLSITPAAPLQCRCRHGRSDSTSLCSFVCSFSFWHTWETQSSPDHLSFNALIFMKLKQWLWWLRRRSENVTCPRVFALCYTQFIGLGTPQQFVWSADHPKP